MNWNGRDIFLGVSAVPYPKRSIMRVYPTIFIILVLGNLTWGGNRFIDRNQDGINDWFVDKNGDGINDSDQKKYPHNFIFLDENQDGINDVFTDQDGDGVNDLDNQNYPVIDFDNDQINDITGLPYQKNFYNGYRFGFVIEEKRIRIEKYLDRDGDGMYDRIQDHFFRDMDGDGFNDFFFDRNGDGINDRLQMKHQNRFLLHPNERKMRPQGGLNHRE